MNNGHTFCVLQEKPRSSAAIERTAAEFVLVIFSSRFIFHHPGERSDLYELRIVEAVQSEVEFEPTKDQIERYFMFNNSYYACS